MLNQLIPLYYQIKEEIKSKIESEELPEGSAIPTERAIMRTFNVSRTTARRAVDALIQEGYVYILRGKGTFVKDRSLPQGLLNCASCTEMLNNMGYSPVVEVIKSEVLAGSKKVTRELNLNEGDLVFNIQRVNYVDGIPMNYTNSFVNINQCMGLNFNDFKKVSLYDTLQKQYGIKIVSSERTVEAVVPNLEIAEILKVETNVPILKFNAIVHAEKGGKKILIETYRTYFRSDRAKFQIDS